MDEMKIEIVRELTGRYMKIVVDQKAGDFGEEVLRYNRIDGILGAHVRQVDNRPQYMYEIGDRISLSELFRRGQMTAGEVKRLINQLVRLLENAGEYFLDERNLVLDCDYLFVDERTGELAAAYLDGYGHDVGSEISMLLEKCMDNMNHRDRELVFLVYELHRISKGDNFCLSHLTKLTDGNRGVREGVPEERPKQPKHEPSYAETFGQLSGRGTRREMHTERRERPVALEIERKRNRGIAKGAEKPLAAHKISLWVILKLSVCVLVGLFVLAAAMFSGILTDAASGGPDMQKAVVLVLAVVLGEGYLIRKELSSEREDKSLSGAKEDLADRTTSFVDAGSENAAAHEKTEALDRTVVLDRLVGRDDIYLNLVPEDWQREEIKVRKSPFFIGKSADRADGVICEGEVSRVHAKLVIDENGVYVIDQESTNGTYVNGDRLVPWERRRLEDGDRIGFSSVYYRIERVDGIY